MFKRIHILLEGQSSISLILSSLGLILLLGLVDYSIGTQVSFSVFYVIPIAITSWYLNRRAGVSVSVCAAAMWLVAEVAGGNHTPMFLISFWNSLVRFLFFLITVFFITTVKKKLKIEEYLADTDFLTGLKNSRAFYEIVEAEVERSRRYKHPLTIAYIDLDNFKHVNDTMGHDAGDVALKIVAGAIRNNVRHSDVIGRLGGDEFSGLFPETGYEAAESLVQNVIHVLREATKKKNLPITFSIGMITFVRPMETVRDMIKAADDLMYDIKKKGKNSIIHKQWG